MLKLPPRYKLFSQSLIVLGVAGFVVCESAQGEAPGGVEVLDSVTKGSLTNGRTSFFELNKNVHVSGKDACSDGCGDHGAVTAPKEPKKWDAEFVEHLKAKHPNKGKGVGLITRAINQEDYKLLPEVDSERLVEYAEFAAGASADILPHLCWGEKTYAPVKDSFDLVRSAALTEGEVKDPQAVFQASSRWTSTATDGATGAAGTPITLTWGFVPDGTVILTTNGRKTKSNLISKLNSTYGSSTTGNIKDAPWFEMFETSFAYWADVTGNTYVFESNDDGGTFAGISTETGNSGAPGVLGTRADVRIAGRNIDGDSNTLAFNYSPNSGDMVIDTNDSANFTNNTSTKALLRNVIAHEHGHGLGFSHVCPINKTKLMEPSASRDFVGVQFDDMLTAQGSYGDKLERSAASKHNDTVETARDLGELSSDYSATNLSISTTGDVDVYKFQVPAGKKLSVTVAPTTVNPYLEGSQVNGSCSSGSNFDPRTRQNLNVRVLGTDGKTVLASANSAAIGQSEKIDNVTLSSVKESYYIQVMGGGENASAKNNAQVYNLNLSFSDADTLGVSDFQIVSESCAPSNGAVDPDEQVTARLKVSNTGSGTIRTPIVTLQASDDLTVVGGSSKELADLAAGESVEVDFSFSLSGDCGASRTLSFQLNAGGSSTTYARQLSLGKLRSVIAEDFEESAGMPDTLSMDSGQSAGDWKISSDNPIAGDRSISAIGVDGSGANSAYLTINSFTASGGAELRFKHSYDFEAGFDGGRLEIKIGEEVWTEWTSAGGSITQNSYNGTVSRFPSSQDVWTGNSGGVLNTKATFPSSALGKSVQVRWHFDSDPSVASGAWRIDDINIAGYACCDGTFPVLAVSATDSVAKESNVSDTAEFSISSSVESKTNLSVAYTVSGTATSGSDFVALAGTATIGAGSQVVTIPVTALVDSITEGNETVVLTLSNSADYAITAASASITIEDALLFGGFQKNNFGSGTTVNTGDTEDFDGDGTVNLVEYALGQDPAAPDSSMESTVTEVEGVKKLSLSFEQNLALTDVSYIVEASGTLGTSSWGTDGVILEYGTLVDGKRTVTATIDMSAAKKFLRLRIERNSLILPEFTDPLLAE